MLAPLQLPGAPELLVILLVFLLPLLLIALLVGAVVYVLRHRGGRTEALEARVDALEAELSELDRSDDDRSD